MASAHANTLEAEKGLFPSSSPITAIPPALDLESPAETSIAPFQ